MGSSSAGWSSAAAVAFFATCASCTPRAPAADSAPTNAPAPSGSLTDASSAPPEAPPAPSAGPKPSAAEYHGGRREAFEQANPNCIGHSHLSHCFYRLSLSPLGLVTTVPPPYSTWASTRRERPHCTDRSDGAQPPSCRNPERKVAAWVRLAGAPASLRLGESCGTKEDVCEWWLEARGARGAVVRIAQPGFADAVQMWATAEADGSVLLERSAFVGE